MSTKKELANLLKLLLKYRHLCFIPEEKQLLGWTAKARQAVKGK